jgi:phosphoribosylanthranilate isomerase
MHRTRIKICGITRVEDALAAAHAGADAIGLVFHAPSPRAVEIDAARAICDALPAFVSSVALFVNETVDTVQEVIRRVQPSLLQFHGDEEPGTCARFTMPYLRALRVGAGMRPADLLEFEARFPSARALLLDAHVEGLYGGSGRTFDWSLIPDAMRERIVLSGGLAPENVGEAVRRVRPWAVDVSSGVEMAGHKGLKDHAKITQFIEAVRHADV